MKTKDLISALQAADPSGELEVCCGNTDIHFVNVEPAYYDGCLQVLTRDPTKTGRCYDIIGAEYRSSGMKVVIHDLSVASAVWNSPDMPVNYDSDHSRRNYEHQVEKWRAEARADA